MCALAHRSAFTCTFTYTFTHTPAGVSAAWCVYTRILACVSSRGGALTPAGRLIARSFTAPAARFRWSCPVLFCALCLFLAGRVVVLLLCERYWFCCGVYEVRFCIEFSLIVDLSGAMNCFDDWVLENF